VKYCPTCSRRFDDESSVCRFDETRLRERMIDFSEMIKPTLLLVPMLICGKLALDFAVDFFSELSD